MELHQLYNDWKDEMSEDLPKQELLIKLLKMTTSSHDGEAVAAVRRANALLASAGWDWERLIHGKIKVIEDPFKHVNIPTNDRPHRAPPPPPPPPKPATPPPPRHTTQTPPWNAPPPPPPQRPKPSPQFTQPQAATQPRSTKANLYDGWCWCCGDVVLAGDGFIFDPKQYNSAARNPKSVPICKSCNTSKYANVRPTAAPRQRPLSSSPPLNAI